MNDVNYNADGTREGQNECTCWPISVITRADMASREWAVMGLESRAVSSLKHKYNIIEVGVFLLLTGLVLNPYPSIIFPENGT